MAYWRIKPDREQLVHSSSWFDRTGKQIGVLGDSRAYADLELSPDQKRASVSTSSQAGADIWLYDVTRGLPTRFTFGPGLAFDFDLVT